MRESWQVYTTVKWPIVKYEFHMPGKSCHLFAG